MSLSGYYEWKSRANLVTEQHTEKLDQQLKRIFESSDHRSYIRCYSCLKTRIESSSQ